MSGPFINDEYSDVFFALYSLEAPGLPPRLLVRKAETLRERLLHVPGVKNVNILGERPERIFVDFSYQRLATLGVSPTEIFDALARQNAVTPAGSVDTNGPRVFIRLDGAYDDLEKIQKFGADKLGGPILIFPIGTPRDTTDPTPKPPPFK